MSVLQACEELLRAVDLFGKTRLDEWRDLGAGSAVDRLREVIKRGSDDETVASYVFKAEAWKFVSDTSEAGVFVGSAVALRATLAALGELVDQDGIDAADGGPFSFAGALATATGAWVALEKAGAEFGYDGSRQNRLAAPTPYLIVFDTAGGAAYGIQLITA